MDNTENRSSLLYFVDEAIGFRKSIHHLHRWLETNSRDQLEQLIIEVGREHFIDFWPLLHVIRNADSDSVPVEIKKLSEYRLVFTDQQLADALNVLHKSQTDLIEFVKFIEMCIGCNTLVSCTTNNDIVLLGQVLGTYYPKEQHHILQLANAINNNPTLNWKDALSRNQIKSKFWLLDKLNEFKICNITTARMLDTAVNPTALIVGGWVGMIPFLASMRNIKLGKVVNIDIDTSVHAAALELNLPFYTMYKNSAEDIRSIDISTYKRPVVIDTIVEHFKDHGEWVKTLPAGTNVILQGNNMFDVPDHVNCHNSLAEFLSSCGLKNILWAGELALFKCTRFMAIGTT
jgi:hypothetical protein